jgi:hypothetical protein
MSEQRIKTMDYDEFQLVAEQFIERSSHEFGEMPASSFFQLLMEKMAERVTETIELEVDPPMGAVQVARNEILIGDQRIVVKLKDKPLYPKAG